MPEKVQGLHLHIPLRVRLVSYVVIIFGYVLCFWFLDERVLLVCLILWTTIFMRGLFYAPEMTIYPNGIETNRLGFRHFTYWQEIQTVRVGEYVSQIYPKNIHPLTKYFLYSYLMIIFWRGNYKEAMEIVKENVQQAQTEKPQRVYE